MVRSVQLISLSISVFRTICNSMACCAFNTTIRPHAVVLYLAVVLASQARRFSGCFKHNLTLRYVFQIKLLLVLWTQDSWKKSKKVPLRPDTRHRLYIVLCVRFLNFSLDYYFSKLRSVRTMRKTLSTILVKMWPIKLRIIDQINYPLVHVNILWDLTRLFRANDV